MKKYFNLAIATQIICLLYTIIHNSFYLGQNLMFLVGGLSLIASIFLFWQCFTNKDIKGKQKWIGLFFASFPVLWLLGVGLFMLLFAFSAH
jgi:hypothetical protein